MGTYTLFFALMNWIEFFRVKKLGVDSNEIEYADSEYDNKT